MKRFISFFVLVISLVSFGLFPSEIAFSADFRNIYWGMSKTEVILSEPTLPGEETETKLVYRPDHAEEFTSELKNDGLWIVQWITYLFEDGKLYQAEQWLFPPIINDPNFDYEFFYTYLLEALNEQYGGGNYEEIWKDEPINAGKTQSVYVGELTRKTTWLTSKSEIVLTQARSEHLGNTIIKTLVTYKQRRISLGEALDILFEYPEVKSLREGLHEAGAHFGVMYENGNNFEDDFVTQDPHYVFRVYESLDTHIVTYGYYQVCAETGAISRWP